MRCCRFELYNPGLVIMALFLVGSLAGCQRDEISEYKIRRHRGPSMAPSTPTNSAPQQMIAGIAQRPAAAWFFKIFGDAGAVATVEQSVAEFMQSIEFGENGMPSWELPEGWREMPPQSQFTRNVFLVPAGQQQLQLTVSDLPGQQDLLSNVNRWERQLQIPESSQLGPDFLEQLPYRNGTMLIFRGRSDQTQAADRKPPEVEELPADSAAKSADVPVDDPFTSRKLKFVVPAGWRQLEDSPFVEAKLVLESDEGVSISVTRMAIEFADWEKQVQQWLGDLGLDPGSETPETEAVQVCGVQGQQILLDSKSVDQTEESPDPLQAICAVMFITDNSSFFVKMKGPRSAVLDQQAEFSKLIESMRLD